MCPCGNPVEHTCITCGDSLCSNCKDAHLQRNDARNHSVVKYVNKPPGLVRFKICLDHEDNECTYWCQTCAKEVCAKCVLVFHYGHECDEFKNILQEKRRILKTELENLERTLKEWQQLMVDAKKATTNFRNEVEEIAKELEETANDFHKAVNEILENNKKYLRDIEASYLSILHEQEKKVSDGLEKVKQEIKDCEDTLRDGDIKSLLENESEQESKIDILIDISPATPPVFTPSQIKMKSLAEMFGKLTATKPMIATEGNATTCSQSSYDMLQESQTMLEQFSASPGHVRQLMTIPSEESKFNVTKGYLYRDLVCVGSGLAWMHAGLKTRNLQLVDTHGIVKDTIETEFNFGKIAISPKGAVLLTDSSNNSIKSISRVKKRFTTGTQWEAKKLFNTQWAPSGLCCLQSGSIAVTFKSEGRVFIYSSTGNIRQRLDKEMFRHPDVIGQSKINSNLFIIDKKDQGSPAAGKVLSLNENYKRRYEYVGNDGNEESFFPCDLCTDDNDHVLVIDDGNHEVLILDNEGQFVKFLLTKEQGLDRPVVIDVDNEKNAWVGHYGHPPGCVKIMKYLQ